MDRNVEICEVTLDQTVSIWWSMMWRATLMGMLVGAILGFIGGYIFMAVGRPELAGIIGALLGWLASIPVSIWALRAALSKKHGGYSVALVKSI